MNEATKQFALAHADDDVRQLALKGCRDAEVDMTVALQQINGRQAARSKIPSWAVLDDIHYPVPLSMEQCSSEATARYKALLVATSSPTGTYRKLVDLTGGFGVDFAFMAENFDESVYVERDETLCAIVYHNLQVISPAKSLTCSVVNAEAEEFIHRMEEHVALIFIDPARRDNRGARTYSISDCTPDVLPLIEELLAKADHVLLKLSPMLDWRKAVDDVGKEYVEQVHIVAVGGECKELLLLLSAKGSLQPQIICSNDGQQETFRLFGNTETAEPQPPQNYLFEPHAALMKGGFFGELAQRYGVAPLAPNSHLFTAPEMIEGFPGRAFRITAMSTMNKQELKEKVLPLKQANISVRNFPMSAIALRKKLKIKDGGDHYIFATTLADNSHVLLLCNR